MTIYKIYSTRVSEHPGLMSALVSYLLLAGLDAIHHFHVATVLGRAAAVHAVWAAAVLIPLAIVFVFTYSARKRKILLWGFLAIAWPAAAILGGYHGGWDHLLKILAYTRINETATNLNILFPAKNWHLWFYEISGVLEFFLGILTAYTLTKIGSQPG